MKSVARVVGILLLLAIIPGLVSLQPGSGQSLTTITSLQTVTTETVVTKFSVSTTQSTGYSTVTTTQFATSSLAQPRRLLVYQHTFETVPEEYGCTFDQTPFTAQTGQVVRGTISSDHEISVYLMSQQDYDVWNRQNTCNARDATLLIDEVVVDTYPFELVIPSSGRYQFVFLNYSHENGAKVDLNADTVGTVSESSVVMTRTYTQQSYSTESVVVSTIVTRTATSRQTEQVGQAGFSMGGSSLLLMVVGIVVGVAVVVGLFVLRSRQGKPKTGTKLYEPEVEETPSPEPVAPPSPPRSPPPGMKFCVHCGEAIPRNARFCTKIGCGKPQG